MLPPAGLVSGSINSSPWFRPLATPGWTLNRPRATPGADTKGLGNGNAINCPFQVHGIPPIVESALHHSWRTATSGRLVWRRIERSSRLDIYSIDHK